jgi:DnaK suppressor protein
MMYAIEHRSPLATAERPTARPDQPGGPHWRARLEARWRARLQEVTELSLAYATISTPDGAGGPDGAGEPDEARSLMHRAVAARRQLADVEEALGRLAAGTFGRCEQCGSSIGRQLLSVIPEARYCPRCAGGARQAQWC